MKKIKVLVRDDNRVFLKMFKKELLNEFQFIETSLINNNQNELMNFDRFLYVVYNKSELIQFLNLEKSGSNVLVCLFNEQLYRNLPFLEEIYDLILLDGFQTKTQLIKDLKTHFKTTLPSKFLDRNFLNTSKNQSQFHNFFKTKLLFI